MNKFYFNLLIYGLRVTNTGSLQLHPPKFPPSQQNTANPVAK